MSPKEKEFVEGIQQAGEQYKENRIACEKTTDSTIQGEQSGLLGNEYHCTFMHSHPPLDLYKSTFTKAGALNPLAFLIE
jgi:hypothetical protein